MNFQKIKQWNRKRRDIRLWIASGFALAMTQGSKFTALVIVLGLFMFAGCAASQANNSGVSRSAARSNVSSTQVEKCANPLGTLAFYEDRTADWYSHLKDYKITSVLPILKLLAQQTNCFIIINNKIDTQEKALTKIEENKDNFEFHKEEIAEVDYTISPEIFFSKEKVAKEVGEATSTAGMIGSLLGPSGVITGSLIKVVGILADGFNKKETQTTLVLIENRSGVQLTAAIGISSHTDFFGLGGIDEKSLGTALAGYSRTPEGKTLVNAFLDSMNQLVIALKDYKAQEVKDGLGKGGTLKVGQ